MVEPREDKASDAILNDKELEWGECRLPDGYLQIQGTEIIVEKIDPHEEFLSILKKSLKNHYSQHIKTE
ncbi:MAG: hypothetical protein N2654_04115 [Deltaproteobacteria bacterium]|nr:hypothetical protein [Deltaproteobacteria bacterium]